MCAYFPGEQRLEVYDAGLHKYPLFVHQLHEDTGSVFWHRKVMFCVLRDPTNLRGGEQLSVVSALLTAAGDTSGPQISGFFPLFLLPDTLHSPQLISPSGAPREAVLQSIELAPSERICGFASALPPQPSLREKQASVRERQAELFQSRVSDAESIAGRVDHAEPTSPSSTHEFLFFFSCFLLYVALIYRMQWCFSSAFRWLDTIYVWTQDSVYELELRNTPEQLFENLLLHVTYATSLFASPLSYLVFCSLPEPSMPLGVPRGWPRHFTWTYAACMRTLQITASPLGTTIRLLTFMPVPMSPCRNWCHGTSIP